MAKFYPELAPEHQAFIARQQMFFVASAPPQGRINLSPKGMNTFRCLSAQEVAYLDLTGSGNETAAHVCHDGRLTIMFCSFTAEPLILRLYGRGRVVRIGSAEGDDLAAHFESIPGARQLIVLRIESVQTSCGFGVPLYDFGGERDTLRRWAENKGVDGIAEYQRTRNHTSIDGLPTGLVQDQERPDGAA